MKRVLVTGVAGFLGSHIADQFIARGEKVVGIDNLIGGYLENVPKEVEFYNLDLNDLEAKGTKPFTYHLPLEIINDKTPKTWTDKLM